MNDIARHCFVPAARGGWRGAARGFTLLEVLVALAILGLVMLALVRVAAQEADSLRHLRERSHAEWIASNAIAEARIGGAIQPGRREGEVDFGGRRYRWLIDVQDTPVAGIRRLDAAVFAPDATEPAGRMTGFVSAR
jgi:general secretion pathway protein I